MARQSCSEIIRRKLETVRKLKYLRVQSAQRSVAVVECSFDSLLDSDQSTLSCARRTQDTHEVGLLSCSRSEWVRMNRTAAPIGTRKGTNTFASLTGPHPSKSNRDSTASRGHSSIFCSCRKWRRWVDGDKENWTQKSRCCPALSFECSSVHGYSLPLFGKENENWK